MKISVVSLLAVIAVVAASDNPWITAPRRRLSLARIDTPFGDIDNLLFRHRQDDTGWTEQDLDLRSTEYATQLHSIPLQERHKNELRLHIDDNKSTPTRSTQLHMNLKSSYKKTGTTIAGCVCCGHVILAADTRATEGSWVADKTAQKLHPLAHNAWCAGAGTSADLEFVTRLCLFRLALDQLRWNTIGNDISRSVSAEVAPMYTTVEHQDDENALLVGTVTLEQVCTFFQERLFKAQGQLGVNLILGCVSGGSPHLRAFHEHGSMDVDLPFAALGSGGLAAMSILERGFHRNLRVPEAIELVQSAIVAGIQNDLGSGSQVDLCVISPDGSSRMQRCVVPSQILDDILPMEEEVTHVEHSAGTNGFGNTPFGINSQRVIVRSQVEEFHEQWSILLGTSLQADT